MKQQKSLECAPENKYNTENLGIIFLEIYVRLVDKAFVGINALSSDRKGRRRHFDH